MRFSRSKQRLKEYARAKEDELARSPVHPSIPQGERTANTVSVWFSVHGEVSNHERNGAPGTFYKTTKEDGFVKSHESRHPGESRGLELLVIPGFRLSPE
jgi:hypothetical protein